MIFNVFILKSMFFYNYALFITNYTGLTTFSEILAACRVSNSQCLDTCLHGLRTAQRFVLVFPLSSFS